MLHRGITRVYLFLVATLLLTVVPAAAQGPGVRGGISVDPDQAYVGVHYETGALVDRLHFKPNAEVGFGDDVVFTGLNMEFVYKFPSSSSWRLYAGGGPAINIVNRDDDAGGGTDTDAGLNLLLGAEHRRGLFFEIKFGVVDSPDFKFGVGWTFR
jgi:hypothetical protein